MIEHPHHAWRVCYTKPHQEFRAEQNLASQGYEVYLPTILTQKICRGQLINKTEPLFSRYCFVRGQTQQTNWAPVRSTQGVLHLLRFGVAQDPASVPDTLIQAIYELCQSRPPEKTLFKESQTVQIQDGPLKGLGGLFQKVLQAGTGEKRALVLIEILGRAQSVRVPAAQLRAA